MESFVGSVAKKLLLTWAKVCDFTPWDTLEFASYFTEKADRFNWFLSGEIMSKTAKQSSAGGLLEEKRQWHTIYPQYINSNLTIQLGRRLAKSKCVPDPRWQEIRDVLAVNSAKFDVEAFPDKVYNREVDKENLVNRGYIKYRLKDSSFKNKAEVLTLVAQLIPKLKTRQNVKTPADSAKPSSSTAASNQQSNAPSGGGGGGGGGGGNKKKKGRR